MAEASRYVCQFSRVADGVAAMMDIVCAFVLCSSEEHSVSAGFSAADPSMDINKHLQWMRRARLGIASLGHARAILRNEPGTRQVLQAGTADGCLPRGSIIDDVVDISAATLQGLREKPQMLTAGFPCQDICQAGQQRGLAGNRSDLFFLKKSFASLMNALPCVWFPGEC